MVIHVTVSERASGQAEWTLQKQKQRGHAAAASTAQARDEQTEGAGVSDLSLCACMY